ncbi:hypothetical protein [Herbidospora cretacea]|uniref:hypothetical protein n=1 Tax=Herbidospora cretacea TaxID=28444 RepID=UPI000774A4AB|nr:hypothetical protein [Herbidospora cretacea]
MSKYVDRAAVASKIDHEGGIYSWLQYGAEDYEMPDDETSGALRVLKEWWGRVETEAAGFMALLPEHWSED